MNLEKKLDDIHNRLAHAMIEAATDHTFGAYEAYRSLKEAEHYLKIAKAHAAQYRLSQCETKETIKPTDDYCTLK